MNNVSLVFTGVSIVIFLVAFIWLSVCLRKVVPTNMTHTVQYRKKTIPYGSNTSNGNVYYKWPSWIPFLGVSVTTFSDSIFDITLDEFKAFDEKRVPFVVTVKAFFQVSDSETVVKRTSSQHELIDQLNSILQGAVRRILSNMCLEDILSARKVLADQFTEEVTEQVKAWGVIPIKAIEFMDITDAPGSKVIATITEKERSRIQAESEIAIADNTFTSQTRVIEVERATELLRQTANKEVSLNKVNVQREVDLAQETTLQEVAVAKVITTQRNNEVDRTTQVGKAQNEKERAIIEQDKVSAITIAEAKAQNEISVASAEASASRRKIDNAAEVEVITSMATANKDAELQRAASIREVGIAQATAERARLEAPVQADIMLAEKIATLPAYQSYLVGKQAIDAQREVGIAHANALVNAEIKLVVNTGDISKGLSGISKVISPDTGSNAAGFLENLANSDIGKSLLNSFMSNKEEVKVNMDIDK